MPSKATVRIIKPRGTIDKMLRRTKKGGYVDAGIVQDKVHPKSGSSLVTIATSNEYGTTDIPERSFLRSTLIEHKKAIRAIQRQSVVQVLLGKTTKQKALERQGKYLKTAIQLSIVSMSSPGNAPSTIERKGFDDPLVDTMFMHNNISYEVVK